MQNKQWQAEHKKLKTMWVVAIMMFWFSVSFQSALFVMDGTLNLILMSIILGMLVIGLALKIKIKRHEATGNKGGAN